MNRKTIFRVLGLTLVGLILAGPSQAMILFNQDLNTGLSGTYSNTGGQVRADDFTLGNDAVINDVHWYGFYEDSIDLPDALDFQIRFYLDAAGLPGTLVYDRLVTAALLNTGLMVTGGTGTGSPIYRFDADPIDPLGVDAGETLWVSIAEDDDATESTGGTQWLWNYNTVGTLGSAEIIENGMDEWEAAPGDLAFYLTGDSSEGPVIPEPATMLLFGSGVLGAFVKKRRP